MEAGKQKNKVRVLVFPCGSEIGLEIHQALKLSTHVELFGASSVSDHGRYVYMNYREGLPFVDDPDFINRLNDVIDEYKIDLIFPAHDSVVLKLAENKNSLHCEVIGSPVETCRVCRSKRETYEVFEDLLDVPRVYGTMEESIEGPIFMKPDVGQGSKGIVLAKSKAEADFFLQRDAGLIPMEYIPGPEYTIDCFTDRHGVLRYTGPRKRVRINNGISVDTLPVKEERFYRMAEKINETLKFRGVWFFQAKEKANKDLALLEVAPRVGGAMGLTRNMGINLALLSVFDRLDMDVEICTSGHSIEMDRALINRFKTSLDYQHVYVDLDDTIIIGGSVNIWMTAFLYQCRNRGIKIHLLSRHAGDIGMTLQKFHIEGIFDEVVRLGKTEQKADYIREKQSIFIDDSFAERYLVTKKTGIPAFDVSSIESLLDWRA